MSIEEHSFNLTFHATVPAGDQSSVTTPYQAVKPADAELTGTEFTATVSEEGTENEFSADVSATTLPEVQQEIVDQIIATQYAVGTGQIIDDVGGMTVVFRSSDAQPAGAGLLSVVYGVPNAQPVVDNGDGTYSVTITQEFSQMSASTGIQETIPSTRTFTFSLAEMDTPFMHGDYAIDVNGRVEGTDAGTLHANARAETVFDFTKALLTVTDKDLPQDWTPADAVEFVFGFVGRTGAWADMKTQMSDPNWSGSVDELDFSMFETAFGKPAADGVALLVDEGLAFGQTIDGLAGKFETEGGFDVNLDLSQFRAAPGARSGHLPFESDRAFPTQC